MRTVETNITVTSDGHLSGEVPLDIPAGEYRVVLLIDVDSVNDLRQSPLKSKPYELGLVSDAMTLRREDIYDDSGR